MSITVTLRYQGKEYTFVDGYDYQPWHHSDGTVARTAFEVAEYLYTEGNYGCDCNRSAFLARYCGVDFSDGAECGEDEEWTLECGHEIELVSLDYVKFFYDESIGCEARIEYEQRPSGLYAPVVAGKEQAG